MDPDLLAMCTLAIKVARPQKTQPAGGQKLWADVRTVMVRRERRTVRVPAPGGAGWMLGERDVIFSPEKITRDEVIFFPGEDPADPSKGQNPKDVREMPEAEGPGIAHWEIAL